MLFSRIKQICLYGNLHSARFLLATAETVWCISLFWPGDTFERPTYAVMAQFADETTWAIVFGVTVKSTAAQAVEAPEFNEP